MSLLKKILISFVSFSQILFWVNIAHAGFGITPPYFRSDTLTRGSQYTQEIILVRGDPVDDLKAEITVNVPKINEWITIDLGNDFPLPSGKKQVPMKVTITVPDDAKYGTYKGNIRVKTSAPDGPQSGVSLALGAQIDVDLRIVDHISDFDIRRVELSEIEEGYSQWFLDYPGRITFGMYVENTGNVPTTPTKVRFDIYNKKGDRLLESTENIGEISEVKPFNTQKVNAYLPTQLPAGGYLVKYQVYKDEEVVRKGELTLSILPPGTVPGYEPFGFEALPIGDKLILGSPIAVLLLLIASIFIIRRLRKRRPKRKGVRRTKSTAPQTRQQTIQRNAPVRAHGSVIDLSRKRR